jgi:hypothetical protein
MRHTFILHVCSTVSKKQQKKKRQAFRPFAIGLNEVTREKKEKQNEVAYEKEERGRTDRVHGECRAVGGRGVLAEEHDLGDVLSGGFPPPLVEIVLLGDAALVLQQPNTPIAETLHPLLPKTDRL